MTPPIHSPSTPTTGHTARCLKSFRLTLQESLEDDATGKGSGSRLAMVMGTMTLCVGLVFALAAHGLMGRDFGGVIQCLILAIAGGGSGPYALKRVVEAARKQLAPTGDIQNGAGNG